MVKFLGLAAWSILNRNTIRKIIFPNNLRPDSYAIVYFVYRHIRPRRSICTKILTCTLFDLIKLTRHMKLNVTKKRVGQVYLRWRAQPLNSLKDFQFFFYLFFAHFVEICLHCDEKSFATMIFVHYHTGYGQIVKSCKKKVFFTSFWLYPMRSMGKVL